MLTCQGEPITLQAGDQIIYDHDSKNFFLYRPNFGPVELGDGRKVYAPTLEEGFWTLGLIIAEIAGLKAHLVEAGTRKSIVSLVSK